MAIEKDSDDAVPFVQRPERRYSHKQEPRIEPMRSHPPRYRATLTGTEDGLPVNVWGGACLSKADAVASAWEALRIWALAGRVPV